MIRFVTSCYTSRFEDKPLRPSAELLRRVNGLTQSERSDIRAAAFEAKLQLEPPADAQKTFVAALNDNDSAVRLSAASLGDHAPFQTRSLHNELFRRLNDKSEKVRRRAALVCARSKHLDETQMLKILTVFERFISKGEQAGRDELEEVTISLIQLANHAQTHKVWRLASTIIRAAVESNSGDSDDHELWTPDEIIVQSSVAREILMSYDHCLSVWTATLLFVAGLFASGS